MLSVNSYDKSPILAAGPLLFCRWLYAPRAYAPRAQRKIAGLTCGLIIVGYGATYASPATAAIAAGQAHGHTITVRAPTIFTPPSDVALSESEVSYAVSKARGNTSSSQGGYGRSSLWTPTLRTPLIAQAKGQNSSAHLYVESQVTGADVIIDGVMAGRVNSYIMVTPGTRIIRIIHSAYHPYEHRMSIKRGKSYKMQVKLKKKPTPEQIAAARAKKQQALKQARLAAQQEAAAAAAPPLAPATPPLAETYNTAPGAESQQQKRQRTGGRKKKRSRTAKKGKKKSATTDADQTATSPTNSFLLATQPPKRTPQDYLYSLLPLGLPQMRHNKPALGALLLAIQAGGVGAIFYFKYLADDEANQLKKYKTRNKNGQGLPTPEQRVYHKEVNRMQSYIAENDQYSMFGIIGASAGYGFSVLEALAVGPKVTSPADLWSLKKDGQDQHSASEPAVKLTQHNPEKFRHIWESEITSQITRPTAWSTQVSVLPRRLTLSLVPRSPESAQWSVFFTVTRTAMPPPTGW